MVSRTDVKKSHILFKGSATIAWLLISCPFKKKLRSFSYQKDRQQATGNWDLGLGIGDFRVQEVQGSAQPLTVKAASLIEEETYIAHDA
jgi:hypothetical protein